MTALPQPAPGALPPAGKRWLPVGATRWLSEWETPPGVQNRVGAQVAGRGCLGRRCRLRWVRALRRRQSRVPELRHLCCVFTYSCNKHVCCDCSGKAWWPGRGSAESPLAGAGARSDRMRGTATGCHRPSCLGHCLTISVWAGPQGVAGVHLAWGARPGRPVSGWGAEWQETPASLA